MPDNRSIEIYRKSVPEPIYMLVREVEDPEVFGIPTILNVTTEDGRKGSVFLNTDEIDAVVISPAGDPNR